MKYTNIDFKKLLCWIGAVWVGSFEVFNWSGQGVKALQELQTCPNTSKVKRQYKNQSRSREIYFIVSKSDKTQKILKKETNQKQNKVSVLMKNCKIENVAASLDHFG